MKGRNIQLSENFFKVLNKTFDIICNHIKADGGFTEIPVMLVALLDEEDPRGGHIVKLRATGENESFPVGATFKSSSLQLEAHHSVNPEYKMPLGLNDMLVETDDRMKATRGMAI